MLLFSLIRFFLVQSSHETLNVVEEKPRAEAGKDRSEPPGDTNGNEPPPGRGPGELRQVEPLAPKDSTSLSSESSGGESESESEDDAGEYRPGRAGPAAIAEEAGEEEAAAERGPAAQVGERPEAGPEARPGAHAGAAGSAAPSATPELAAAPKTPAEKGALQQDGSEDAEDERHRVNGEVSHVDIDVLPQIICCSEVNGRLERELNSSCFSGGEHLPFLLLLSSPSSLSNGE